MQDRIPLHPGRVKLTQVNGNIYDIERADEPQQAGTPLNKANLFNSAAEARYGASTPNEAFNFITREWNVTVPASGWTEQTGYFSNRVTVSGMKAAYNPIYAPNPATVTDSPAENEAFGYIAELETFDGYIIVKAIDMPDTDIHIRIRGV